MASTDTDDILDQEIERSARALPRTDTTLPTAGLDPSGRPADTSSGAFPGNELAGVTKGGTDPIVFDPQATQEFRQGSQYPPGADPYTIYQQEQARTERLGNRLEAGIERRNQLTTEMANLPHPRPPRLQNVPQAPQQNPRSIFNELAPSLMLFATLGSGFVKGHAVQALSAATGLINGWDKGDAEMRQAAIDNWQNKSKQLADQNKVELERYQVALDDRNLSTKDKLAQIGAIAAEFDDQIRLEEVRSGNMRGLFTLQGAQTKGLAQFQAAQVRATGAGGVLATDPQAQSDAIDEMVARRLVGDKTVLQHLGTRSQAIKLEFEKRLKAERERRGISPEDLMRIDQQQVGNTSYQRTTGTMGARIEAASSEVEQVLPQALEASRNLPRGQWVPINQLVQAFQKGTSKPEYYDFAAANFTLKNAYARAMNPQGIPRVHDRMEAEAENMFSKATDQLSYEVVLRRMWREVQASKIAVDKARQGRTGGDINAPMPGATPAPAGAGAAPSGGWGPAERMP